MAPHFITWDLSGPSRRDREERRGCPDFPAGPTPRGPGAATSDVARDASSVRGGGDARRRGAGDPEPIARRGADLRVSEGSQGQHQRTCGDRNNPYRRSVFVGGVSSERGERGVSLGGGTEAARRGTEVGRGSTGVAGVTEAVARRADLEDADGGVPGGRH